MSNEIEFLKAGFFLGYIVVIFIYSMIVIIRQARYIKKVNKYILRTKQCQKLEEYLENSKSKIKVIKHE